jgi:hypothetical protein
LSIILPFIVVCEKDATQKSRVKSFKIVFILEN